MNKYTAIILSSLDISEYDRLYALYTMEQGLMQVPAKGVRRPAAKLAGHLDPITLSEIYIAKSRGRGQITNALTLHNFQLIKSDLDKLQETGKIFKFIGRIFSEEIDPTFFDSLREYLELLEREEDEIRRDVLIAAFWWKMFDHLGHRPQVTHCVRCLRQVQRGEAVYFSVGRGGLICADCRKTDPLLLGISENQIKFLRIVLTNELKNIAKLKMEEKDLQGIERIRKAFTRYNFYL